jgi:hypothetical protein
VLLGKRNPSTNAASAETQIIADNSSYGTRQSNLREGDGGGAIYGCCSGRHRALHPRNNLKDGQAFEFETPAEAADRDRHPRRAVHDERHGRGHRPERRQGDGKDAPTSPRRPTQGASDGLLFARSRHRCSAPTGAASVTRAAVYTVKFNRDVSKCSYTASPVGCAGRDPACSRDRRRPVTVDRAPPSAFHLQVIC